MEDNIKKICKILNSETSNVKSDISSLFYKIGYNVKYIISNKPKNEMLVKVYNTIYKKDFTRDMINNKLSYLYKIQDILDIKEFNTCRTKEELESKRPDIEKLLKDNSFKTVFEIRSNNIKTIKSLLGMLNTVLNNFGLEIKMKKEGNDNYRRYFYNFQRLDIIEDYLVRLDNSRVIIDME